MAATTMNLPAKRKRAQISYAELEHNAIDSAYGSDEEVVQGDIEDDILSDGDLSYGSRKVC